MNILQIFEPSDDILNIGWLLHFKSVVKVVSIFLHYDLKKSD